MSTYKCSVKHDNMQGSNQNEGKYQVPENPVLRTADMVKASHWYCGDDIEGSTHCTGKVLEWVSRTPLDDSPENLENREVLADWLRLLAVKVARQPFHDMPSALRLIDCALGIEVGENTKNYLNMLRDELIKSVNTEKI